MNDRLNEYAAPTVKESLSAAPTVKAEQVQCDTCHGQGEICVGQRTFGYMSMQPPEPIMEVCPDCGGEEAPSLPAAGSAVEEVEVAAFLMEPDLYEPYVSLSRDSRCDHVEPLMAVAQHQRIVSALSAQQSAPELVGVPVECRQRLAKEGKPYPKSSCAACGQFSPKWKECDALLASHAEGGKV